MLGLMKDNGLLIYKISVCWVFFIGSKSVIFFLFVYCLVFVEI